VIYASARRSPLPSLNALASLTLFASTILIALAFVSYRRLTAGERTTVEDA
jgi:ABC-type spermidine/putrescine transport system permease subunit II